MSESPGVTAAAPFLTTQALIARRASASLGISRSDGQVESVETLLRRADIAMYAAKKQGKNRVVYGVLPTPKLNLQQLHPPY